MDQIKISKNGESIILGKVEPYFVEIFDDSLNAEIKSQKSPFQDGSKYKSSNLEDRIILIEGMIIVKSEVISLVDARRKMQRIINPKNGLILISYKENGIVKEIKASAESIPLFPSGHGNKGEYYQKFVINLVCNQPFWNDSYVSSSEMSYLMGGLKFKLSLPTKFSSRGFRKKAINEGDVDTPVLIEFKGPALNPTVTNKTTGEFIKINRELLDSDILTISTSFGEKYIKINGENAFHYIDLDSSFWQLESGDNLLSYESNNDSINTKVKVTWKNQYIGI